MGQARFNAHHKGQGSLLRNGADAFSVQRILGHADLSTTRIYVNLAEADIAAVHRRASPADNLGLRCASASPRQPAKR